MGLRRPAATGRGRAAQRRLVEIEAAQRLVSIIESSDDAIVSKDLDGVITSWNRGAERLFGYTAAEAIGRPITILIPEDRHDEEPAILDRIRRGERVDHYETVRRRRDGILIDISLTVSPLRDATGRVIGASKIARDITDRRRAEERQALLLREMRHRIKNLFTLAGSVVALSARSAAGADELAAAVRERLAALARAHELTLPDLADGDRAAEKSTTLAALLRTILAPYASGTPISLQGPDLPLRGSVITSFALLLHEFATNAAKHGALSAEAGRLDVTWAEQAGRFELTWRESGGPSVAAAPREEGFGTTLARLTIDRQFGGTIERDWQPGGLVIRLGVPLARLIG